MRHARTVFMYEETVATQRDNIAFDQRSVDENIGNDDIRSLSVIVMETLEMRKVDYETWVEHCH